MCTKAGFLAATARGKGNPSPWKVYGTVTEPLIWPADMPTGRTAHHDLMDHMLDE